MAKNERTVYKALSTQQQVSSDSAAAPPIIQLAAQEGDAAALEAAAAAALRRWTDAEEREGLLDLRPEAEYDAGHVVGATSLPWGDGGEVLVARAHELPPRGATLALLAQDPDALEAAAAHLTKSGYRLSFCISMPSANAQWEGVVAVS